MAGIPPEKDKRQRSLEEPLSFSEEPQVSFGVFSVHHRPTDITQSVMVTQQARWERLPQWGRDRGTGAQINEEKLTRLQLSLSSVGSVRSH